MNDTSQAAEQNEKGKAITAKSTSLVAQVIASAWIALWSGKAFLDGSPKITDIILSGLAIAACFSPVYFNLIMDKIKDIKLGGTHG